MRSLRRRAPLPDRVHRVDPPAAVPATPPLPNSYWLIPGRVLAGEHPGGASAEVTRERLGKLLGAGIDSFIDLTHKRELPAYEKLLPDGIEYLRRPIPDHGVLSDPKDMAALLAHIAGRLRAGRILYLHCRAGIGRTG